MRLKIALLCALVLPLGTAKADVVALSNSVASDSPTPMTTDSSLYIKFTTSGTGAFQLGTLTLAGGAGNDGVSYALKDSSNQIINGISDTVAMSGQVLTFKTDLFGAGTYWLEVTSLNMATGYYQGNSTALTGGAFGVGNGLLVLSNGATTDAGVSGVNLFQASLTVNVPEPTTMILTGSALAVGAIGAYFKRRRKPQTEIAA